MPAGPADRTRTRRPRHLEGLRSLEPSAGVLAGGVVVHQAEYVADRGEACSTIEGAAETTNLAEKGTAEQVLDIVRTENGRRR